MPELPEVETVKNKLLPSLKNKTIKSVEVYYEKHSSLRQIKDEKILDIKRKGKYLIFVLESYFMVSHLRMEGKYFITSQERINKHDLVKFIFDDFNLIYNDVRKFGTFNLFNKDEDIYNIYPLVEVGMEPFDIDKDTLYNLLNKRTEPIKSALLDQSIIAGLGNIYVDEVLFLSKINPYQKANTITLEETERIIDSSIKTLNKAIKLGGSTIKSFESLNHEIGHFQTELLVHLREGERCYTCNGYIIKDRCGGRGTYYCPTCQRLNKNQKLIAITGTFSSGKSTVLKILKDLNYSTYSLDEIYNDLFMNSKEMLRSIKKSLGVTSKEELRDLVFSDESNNKLLMDATHKYVMEALYKKIEKDNSSLIFVEAPLLFEGKLEKTFDKVIDVYESEEVLSQILKNKGFSFEEYQKRIKSQLSKEEKRQKADYIVYNDGTQKDLFVKIKDLLKDMEE